ncbi:MAG TPA: glycosyl hydrolase [Albitalea sp.]|nr:glycosyl hydrolase [Albitalea sp.]
MLSLAAAAATAADVPVGLGHYTTHLRAGGEHEPPAPIARADGHQAPVPTNQWYSSLFFERWPQPLYAQPGSYRPTAEGFAIDRPIKQAVAAAQRDENDIVAMHHAALTVVPDFAIDRVQPGKTSDWAVEIVSGDATGSMSVTIAHGSPYSFHRLSRGDATFRAEQPIEVFERSPDGRALGVIASGKPFGLFGPAGCGWETLPGGRIRLVLPEGRRFFSVAVLPSRDAGVLARFHRHAYAFITDTRAEFSYDEKRSDVTTTFSVTTTPMEGPERGTLIGLYPHQWHHNPLLPATLPYGYDTIRGPLKLIAGQRFQTRYRYGGVMPFWPGLGEPAQAAQLARFLADDLRAGPDALLGNRGTYWEGKGFNRALQVMNIAEQQGDLARRDALLAAIKRRLEEWFAPEDNAERYFHHDAAVGTLIGYPDEFGSALEVNDHHFHYGYWIQAAAQVALRDPAWARRDRWGGMVEMLAADIATLSRDDPMFPRLRHFDVYEGHSWANGLGQFYDGNNQESSSEAINAWAALILWGEATGNKALRDTGVCLYTQEVEAARMYWFDLAGLVFPPEYGHRAAGIVWSDKFVHDTWWTADPREVHGINFLPLTAASLYLGADPAALARNLASMDEDFQRFLERGGKAPKDIWQDVLVQTLALADPKKALAQWDPDGSVEDGESRTHTFHWLHSLLRFGRPRLDIGADTPLYAVFAREDGRKTYLAYNAAAAPRKVRFSDGTELRVAPRTLGMRSTPASITRPTP